LSAALSLILIVAAAYLAAHVLFAWLAARYRIVSGAEYVVLGILLGPQVSGFMSADVIASFAPIMILALGWTGAALGMNFYLPRLIKIPGATYTIAILEAVLTFGFVASLMLVAFSWAFDMSYAKVILPALSLGAIATATSSVATRGSTDPIHPVAQQLETTASVDGAIAIVSFGLLLCIVHVQVPVADRWMTATEWAAIAIGIGFVCGSLFHLFLGHERNPDRLFIAMAGAIILASGAAAYLRLSPLLPALIIGAILVNTSDHREELQRLMSSVEKPLYFVLLLFAGASWQPSQFDWHLPVFLYVFVRLAGKIGAARLSARMSGDRALLARDWGRGLISQGTIALAIALSYSLNDNELVPNVVFTAAIISVITTDFFGMRIVNALTNDVGNGDMENSV
jgi:Kef-type K+ transport system membrane component KefB